MTATDLGSDPRLDLSPEEVAQLQAEEEPVVGRAVSAGPGPVLAVCVLAVFAVGLFLMLNARRAAVDEPSLITPAASAAVSAPAPPLVLPPPRPVPVTTTSLEAATAVQPVPVPAPQPAPPFGPAPVVAPAAPAVDPAQRRRAPAVVVDLDSGGARPGVSRAPLVGSVQPAGAASGSDAATSAMAALTPAGAAAALIGAQMGAGAVGAPGAAVRNSDEAFAERVGEASGAARAVATVMRDLGSVVPQGAMIPGVLETAINSDLPGYTRAIVSRDVRSFDGKYVLIPRGSRLIGQYKSAVALGQSRAFIIWTRVTRPDGVSIQIGSPGTDALGRGGLEGEVDRHFFARFGGSILLSVLNAGVNAVSDTPTTQIAIGSPGAAASAASSALQGSDIAPTIKVKQGEAIRIFVARDLDFSNVGPAR